MVLSAKVISFTKTPTSGSNQDQSITGVGFQPKIILFWTTLQTSSGLAEGAPICFGMSTSASENACRFMYVGDNLATSAAAYGLRDKCILEIDSGGITLSNCVLKTFDSDGFTITWQTVSANQILVHALCLGGSSITNAAIAQYFTPTVTGSDDQTLFSFTPDCIIQFEANRATLGASTHGTFSFAAAKSSSAQWAIALDAENARTTAAATDTWRYQRTDKSLANLRLDTGALEEEADFTQFITNGFRQNFTAVQGAGRICYVLGIQGATIDIGTFNVSASTGSQTISGLTSGITPSAVMLTSFGTTSNTSVIGNLNLSIGAATSSSNRVSSSIASTTDINPTRTARDHVTDKCLKIYTDADTATSSTLEVALDLTSFGDGQFVVNKATNTGTLGTIQVIYITFGAIAGLTRITKDIILKYNIASRITQNLILKYNLIARIIKSLILKYNLIKFISQNLIVKYNIRKQIVQNFILKYNIIGRTTNNLIVKYNIVTTLARITQNLILKYNLTGRIVSNVILKYNLLNRIIKSVILKYNIQARIIQNLILKYNIVVIVLTRITQNLTIKYNLVARILNNLRIKYVLGDIVVTPPPPPLPPSIITPKDIAIGFATRVKRRICKKEIPRYSKWFS